MKNYCPKCNQAWIVQTEKALFCTECGSKLLEGKVECSNCKEVITANTKFCWYCGVEQNQEKIDQLIENQVEDSLLTE